MSFCGDPRSMLTSHPWAHFFRSRSEVPKGGFLKLGYDPSKDRIFLSILSHGLIVCLNWTDLNIFRSPKKSSNVLTFSEYADSLYIYIIWLYTYICIYSHIYIYLYMYIYIYMPNFWKGIHRHTHTHTGDAAWVGCLVWAKQTQGILTNSSP